MEYSEKSNRGYHKLIKKLANDQKPEALRGLLKDLNPVEIAGSLLQLKLKHQLSVIELMDRERASEVISHLQDHAPILEDIVEEMNTEQLGDLIEEMDKDDAADMVSMLDEEKASQVLEGMPKKDREEITTLMQYDEESAGGIMDPQVVSVRQELTVSQASSQIKNFIKKKEIDEFFVTYVVDEHAHLIGSLSLTKLFMASGKSRISEIMDPNILAVNVDMDQEKVARLAKEYDLVTVPVIDKHLRLVGRITNDDLIDVMYEEYDEDIGQIAGTGDEEVLETSVFKASRVRLPWLLLGMGGGFLAAIVMSRYETAISELPQVAYFIPLIAALGGNIAIQSSSLVVRGLATGEIRSGDLIKRAWKEIRVGLLNGFLCAILLVFLSWWLMSDLIMGVTTGLALLVVVFLAALVGTTVPILLKRVHMDPAIATGPFITTTNDILGIIIYLAITISVYTYQLG
jgi:magnesium transporter